MSGPIGIVPVVDCDDDDRFEATVHRTARFRISVLILGPTGAGKEVVAHRIHDLSPRHGRAMIAVDCAALTASLAESELFGHQRGAFTGAAQSRIGLLEAADGGTLFLDEVGELSPTTQAKLLRTLETRIVQRVGSISTRRIDVRVIAATNRDLDREVREGRFRSDLLYRLDGIRIQIPPLCKRREHIARLARQFVTELSRRDEMSEPELSADAVAALMTYDWPGNVRELRNAIERALVLCEGHSIESKHLILPTPVADDVSLESCADNADGESCAGWSSGRHRPVLSRAEILSALARFAGNQTRAAALLGVSRRTLISRLDALRIVRPCKGAPRARRERSQSMIEGAQ